MMFFFNARVHYSVSDSERISILYRYGLKNIGQEIIASNVEKIIVEGIGRDKDVRPKKLT